MIHLDLGAEPEALRSARALRLPEAIRRWNAWQALRGTEGEDASSTKDAQKAFKQAITGYRDGAVDALHLRQRRKCAYCERPTGKVQSPVEHIRPKLGAEHENGAAPGRDPERYWWLAWSWQNLVFACATCNSTANKGNRFPLREGSPRLQAPTHPASTPLPDACFNTNIEQRLFVHPREDDPLEFLEWAPANPNAAVARWRIALVPRDEEIGKKTKEVLDLDEVIPDIQAHLKRTLWRDVQRIQGAKTNGNAAEAVSTWEEALTLYIDDPEAPFRGPMYWIMKHVWSRLGLQQLGCRIPSRPLVQHQEA